MSVFKCKMCGGTIAFEPGATVGVCDHCGTKQTLPRLDDERRANLYDRANHFRRNNEFDKAAGLYEQILNEDPTDAEAYWSLVLCRYGIEYVEDPAARRRVPTVNRTQYTSVFDDGNYRSALQYADVYQRSIYEQEAAAINEIQKGILAISEREQPFDVFICYKEADANGRRTVDSVLATELYHQLTQEGFKVFFSRITLEDKLGTAYEPYIFAALNSAKVMVVLGTRPEYFNAVWVKNEWSRYLNLIKAGAKKTLIPAYRDMDPYDLPEEFSHLMALDMSRLGFMQDLIRGIKKIIRADEPKPTVKETVVVRSESNVSPLLRRAFLFLEDGNFSGADEYCERVLDQDPENARAYLGKLMAQLHVRQPEELADCEQPFDGNNNYQKAIRFGDESLTAALRGYVDHIKARIENERLTGIYERAVSAMNAANGEAEYKAAAPALEPEPKTQLKPEILTPHQQPTPASTPQPQAIPKSQQKKSERIGWVLAAMALIVALLLLVPRLSESASQKQTVSEMPTVTMAKEESEPSPVAEAQEESVPEGLSYVVHESYVVITGCDKSLSAVVIPSIIEGKPVTDIGMSAFNEHTILSSIMIPDNVTSIGVFAFSDCNNLKSISIPDSVTSIGCSAFSGCNSLRSISIPDNVTSIFAYTFLGCSSLNSISIPDGVTSIGDRAFDGCSSLNSISIPNSVTSIGNWAFIGCRSLHDVYYGGSREQWDTITFGVENDRIKNATIHYSK